MPDMIFLRDCGDEFVIWRETEAGRPRPYAVTCGGMDIEYCESAHEALRAVAKWRARWAQN